jgi:hypothetical protein
MSDYSKKKEEYKMNYLIHLKLNWIAALKSLYYTLVHLLHGLFPVKYTSHEWIEKKIKERVGDDRIFKTRMKITLELEVFSCTLFFLHYEKFITEIIGIQVIYFHFVFAYFKHL